MLLDINKTRIINECIASFFWLRLESRISNFQKKLNFVLKHVDKNDNDKKYHINGEIW